MKRIGKYMLAVLLVAAFVVSAMGIVPQVQTNAADGYKLLFEEPTTKVVKRGSYYFKCGGMNNQYIYISKSKNSGYKDTGISWYGVYANGAQLIYTGGESGKLVINKYVYKTGKKSVAKSVKAPDTDSYWSVSYVKGNEFYLTLGNWSTWKLETYYYNAKSGNLKKLAVGCGINRVKGQYALCQKELRTDVSPYTLMVYKISGAKLTKVTTLAQKSFGGNFVGSNIYYTNYPDYKKDYSMRKAELFKCTKEGKNKKKIATFTDDTENGYVMIQEVTEKYCTYMTSTGTYRYTYSTKKTEKQDNTIY